MQLLMTALVVLCFVVGGLALRTMFGREALHTSRAMFLLGVVLGYLGVAAHLGLYPY